MKNKSIEPMKTYYDEELEEHIAETNGKKEIYNTAFEKMIIDKINEIIERLS